LFEIIHGGHGAVQAPLSIELPVFSHQEFFDEVCPGAFQPKQLEFAAALLGKVFEFRTAAEVIRVGVGSRRQAVLAEVEAS